MFSIFIIFIVSFFAVYFPIISTIQNFVFIGKHFGTGVILSTAFSHLLQDAFIHLNSLNLGKHTGSIILASLLFIFIIEYISTSYVHSHSQSHSERTPLIQPRKQSPLPPVTTPLVPILVLQLGIMIHSFVIGLTLAITDSGFVSLLTAVIFHQLFEGLSLGIRIAALPLSSQPALPRATIHITTDESVQSTPNTESTASSSDLESVLACPNDPPCPHSVPRDNGLLQPPANATRFFPRMDMKTALAFLFAVTTPIGILVGLLWYRNVGGSSPDTNPTLQRARGLLSAISAGLLIYASTVEMLAADFVMDPDRTMVRNSVTRQAVALVSLVAGVVGAGLVG